MAEHAAGEIPLNWDVFVTPGIPIVISDPPPGAKQRLWSPISSTLIYGKRDAVLVDAYTTTEQTNALVDWVAASGKKLTTIYATHGHGDHFFGAGTVLARAPASLRHRMWSRACASRHPLSLSRRFGIRVLPVRFPIVW